MLFLLSLFSLLSFASPREEASDILQKFQAVSNVTQRMEVISRPFIGLPYGQGGPLGEGPAGRFDQDPLYRFDTFDCTTFVETVMALALTDDVDSFEQKMDEIRYENSKVDYLTRNHFPSLQWIPNNIKNGLLKEVNHLVLPPAERKMAVALINLPGWLSKIKIEEIKVPTASAQERQNLLDELRSYASQYSAVEAKLEYLPIDTLVAKPAVLRRIPHGSLINFVRPNWDLTDVIGTHMNVSHQGLIFVKKGIPYLRHASTTGKVMELPLLEYLKKFVNHPTMKGIHLMQLNAQAL